MNLYGASLRKGETPDEISRNAEKLTETFKNIAKVLNTSPASDLATQLSKSKEALNSYLKFASLSDIDSSDYVLTAATVAK